MGSVLGTERSRQKQREIEELLDQLPPEIDLDKEVPFRSWWLFSVVGALAAIPVGMKRKSLAPLLIYGTTGTMLDIIFGIEEHEKKRQDWMKEYIAQHGSRRADGDSRENWEDPSSGFGQEPDPWIEAKRKN
ncbi:uncharacterized protein LOC9660534 [Selaginella moellendorffii]|uniref:uncharacterized protein LOC9660534 n=1 Tax=Selaginella moellendorffii TaxID=88036 RepID=UPI000D1C32E1|nr:uncharacterized protein LOC9660534 [Selaginella moellendorffii]|eukprot:XP_002990958.2 uncharacterized protein LOC9660534 [Selaginella moellendorffii]